MQQVSVQILLALSLSIKKPGANCYVLAFSFYLLIAQKLVM